jgi:hypothetical protein
MTKDMSCMITLVTNHEHNYVTQLHGNNHIQNHVYKRNAYYDLYHNNVSTSPIALNHDYDYNQQWLTRQAMYV